jgi:outer membrane protein
MKNGLVILNVILLAAVGILFYLYFRPTKSGHASLATPRDTATTTTAPGSCKIAYFEMDSVEADFSLAREMKNELQKKEDKFNEEIGRLQNVYQQKYINLQQHSNNMTSTQVDAARNELMQLEQTIKDTRANADQDYQSYGVQKKQEILAMIRDFCTTYNSDKKYAIIIANEPGLVFYKDSTLDITNDLLKGLNNMYGKRKNAKKP